MLNVMKPKLEFCLRVGGGDREYWHCCRLYPRHCASGIRHWPPAQLTNQYSFPVIHLYWYHVYIYALSWPYLSLHIVIIIPIYMWINANSYPHFSNSCMRATVIRPCRCRVLGKNVFHVAYIPSSPNGINLNLVLVTTPACAFDTPFCENTPTQYLICWHSVGIYEYKCTENINTNACPFFGTPPSGIVFAWECGKRDKYR